MPNILLFRHTTCCILFLTYHSSTFYSSLQTSFVFHLSAPSLMLSLLPYPSPAPSLILSPVAPLSRQQPHGDMATNALILTNLSPQCFNDAELERIREVIASVATIRAWAPLRGLNRIIVVLVDSDEASRLRAHLERELAASVAQGMKSECAIRKHRLTPSLL